MNWKAILKKIDAQLESAEPKYDIGDITTMVEDIEYRIESVGAEKTAEELTENAKEALQEYMKLDYKDSNAKEWRQAHLIYYEAARDLHNAIAEGENPTQLSQNALANMVKNWHAIEREMGSKQAQLEDKEWTVEKINEEIYYGDSDFLRTHPEVWSSMEDDATGTFDWKDISIKQDLSEEFIDHFKYELDPYWKNLSMYQRLSEPFIEKYQNKVDWDRIFSYQPNFYDFSQEFLDKFSDRGLE